MTILEKTIHLMIYSLAGKIDFLRRHSGNMANSWIMAGALFGMNICLAGPVEFAPTEEMLNYLTKHDLSSNFEHQPDPVVAARGADILYTDVWVSMGCEEEAQERKRIMSTYQVTDALLFE